MENKGISKKRICTLIMIAGMLLLISALMQNNEAHASEIASQNYNISLIIVDSGQANSSSANYINKILIGTLSINASSSNYINHIGFYYVLNTNQLPYFTYGPNVTPKNPDPETNLQCSFNITDANTLDTLYANYTWYNGSIAKFKGRMQVSRNIRYSINLSKANTSSSDTWNCSITPYDGKAYGTAKSDKTSILKIPPFPKNITIQATIKNTTIAWVNVSTATSYKIYYSSSITGTFKVLNQTTSIGYVDTNKTPLVRYYKVSSVSSAGENISNRIYGKTIYRLKRVQGGNTRNWIAIPLNNSAIRNASALLGKITNATSIVEWNATTQKARTCNKASCPDIACTDDNCNFNIVAGKMYEVNINGNAPLIVNWTLEGEVIPKKNISLYSVSGTFSKNWVSVSANTSITTAQQLITSLSKANLVRQWEPSNQMLYSRINTGPGVGKNFNITAYQGYEITASKNFSWKTG